jgi:hypothetical protein
VLAFGLGLAGSVALARLQSPKQFYNDSGAYWQLGTTFVKEGHFSLLNFESAERGYVLPLIYHLLQDLINAYRWTEPAVVKTFNGVIFALIGTLLAPKLAETIWPTQRWGLAPRLAFTALLLAFWSGYLNFPLSDFPGAAAVLLALIAVAHPDRPVWMLVAGAAGALAMNIRAAYVLLVPMLLILVAWAWFEQRGTAHATRSWRALCVGMLLVGFVAISLPQSLSAHKYHGTWSPVPGATVNLSHAYLTAGLSTQLSVGYVGTDPPIALASVDKTGERLLGELKEEQVNSTGQYLGLIARHPFAMGSILGRHAINGLDQRYSTVYVENLHTWSLRWLRIIGFLFVLLSLIRVMWPAARRRLGPTRWRYAVVLALCVVTSVPLVMETRYMLLVYLLSWMMVLTPGWPRLSRPSEVDARGWRTAAILVATSLIFTAVIWHITSSTTSHIPPLQ